jgi:hypothetical protein
MKRTSLTALTAIGISILACAGGDDNAGGEYEYEYEVEADDLPAVGLTEPWKSMKLPIDDGVVVVSDKTVMLVAYDDASVSGLTSSYTRAIEKNGWSKAEDYSTPDFTAIVYKKGSQQVGFASGVESGLTFAYMEDLDGVTESSSAIASAKKGGSGIPATKKAQGLKKSTTGKKKSPASGGKKKAPNKSKKKTKKGKKGKKKKK